MAPDLFRLWKKKKDKPTPPQTPLKDDLSKRLEALDLEGVVGKVIKKVKPVLQADLCPSSQRPSHVRRSSTNAFPGPSFPVPEIVAPPRPPIIPMHEPHVEYKPSLTMQYALAATSAPEFHTRPPPTPPVPPTQPVRPPLDVKAASDTPPPRKVLLGLSPPAPATERVRASSSPPSPTTATDSRKAKDNGDDRDIDEPVRCSGVTKKGERCGRLVKAPPPLAMLDPDAGASIERFCFQHSKELLEPSGFYSRKADTTWVSFADWIPDYLHPDTQTALRVEMEKPRSAHDVPGYIYTFEIRDLRTPKLVHLKVGRAVNLVKRIDEWSKQCGSKEQVLRGWWPGTVEPDDDGNGGVGADGAVSLMKGRVKAGDKGAHCHRLERLVHLELADLVLHAPYLNSHFPRAAPASTAASGTNTGKNAASGNGKGKGKDAKDGGDGKVQNGAASPAKAGKAGKSSLARIAAARQPCPDCDTVHKEIFSFVRPERGRYKGKEWELLVKPVIEKWGAFVEAYV